MSDVDQIDFTSENCESVFVRDYPEEPAGWVDGVYQSRVESVAAAPYVCADGSQGLAMRGRRLVEESEPLAGDPTTIGRFTYYLGTAVCLGLSASNWHVELEVKGADRGQVLQAVVNGDARVRFSLAAGQSRTIAFDVPLTKRELELCFSPVGEYEDETSDWCDVTLVHLSCTKLDQVAAPAPRILIAADSTIQTYLDRERPQSGWGEWLYWYLYEGHTASVKHDDTSDTVQARVFTGNGPTIYNKALGARGTKNYIEEHRLEHLVEMLRPNDVMLIALGINDSSRNRPMRYLPTSEHAAWLDRYVVSARDRGATPVIVTAIPQDRSPELVAMRAELDEYADVERAYAAEHGVDLIDLRAEGDAYIDAFPTDNLNALFLRSDAFQYASHPDGVHDPVHISLLGAFKYAGVVARGLAQRFDWLRLQDVEAGALESVSGLKALVADGITGREVDLSWDAPASADYYTVEKRNAATDRLYRRAVTIKPSYHDVALFGQGSHIRYVVTAWRDAEAAESSCIDVALGVQDNPCVDLG